LVANWKAGPFGVTMVAGFLALIVVSLLTKPESPDRIARFFEKMQQSSDEATSLEESDMQPSAISRGEDLIMLDIPGWFGAARWSGFFRRYREDLGGFVLACGSVALLVLMAWALMQIGK